MNIALTSEQKDNFIYYIDLISSVVNGNPTPEPTEAVDWNVISSNALRNSVGNILGYGVQKLKNKPPQTILNVLENERRFSILKETSQFVEVEKVLQEFEKAHIRNLPLKGYFMKHYYTQSDLRTMTDVDILVEKKNFKKITQIFEELGYQKANLMKSDEIHFSKGVLYFEIQCDLNAGEDDYYNDIWAKVNLRQDYAYSYSMSPEDFYVYMIYHCAKHFESGGLGIRMLIDVSVFLKRFRSLDTDYIASAFEELNILTFANRVENLSLNWFSDKPTVIDNLGEFILYCGTYGTRDIYFYQESTRQKGSYWLNQIFIPYRKLKNSFSYLNNAPVLLPVAWVQYWFTRVFVDRDVHIKRGLTERAKKLNDENSVFVSKLMNELDIK